jgi:hypothetical protein
MPNDFCGSACVEAIEAGGVALIYPGPADETGADFTGIRHVILIDYFGHLAYEVFRNTFLFPFALALLGLSLILVTVWAQKRFRHLLVQTLPVLMFH